MQGHSRLPSHLRAVNISASRMPSCAISSTTSPMKACTKQRLGLLGRNAARHQIEFKPLVERAGGRTVAADHVVGEDFQFRLVVGFRLVRQQQRARHHLAVGLLRVRLDDDLALEDAVAFAVEHRFETLAARAVADGVIDDQRVVDVLAAFEQAGAVDGALAALAGKAHEGLIAHHRAAAGEGEILVDGLGADRDAERRDPQGGAAVAADPDVIEPRAVADHQFERRIDLIVDALRPGERLDQRRLRARLHDHHDPRIHRRAGVAGKHMLDMDRLGRGRTALDAQRHAAAHESGVEPIGGIVAAGDRPGPVVRIFGQEREQFGDRNARIAVLEFAPGRFIAPVDDGDVMRVDAAEDRRDIAFRLGAGRARQRLRLAHQRAQVGVFPLLDAAMRQAFGVEAAEGVLAQGRDRALARQRGARRRKGVAQRLLGRGFRVAHFHVHQAASSANCA